MTILYKCNVSGLLKKFTAAKKYKTILPADEQYLQVFLNN